MAGPHLPTASRYNPPSYYNNSPMVPDVTTIGSNKTQEEMASTDNEPDNKILELATIGLNQSFLKLLKEQSKQNAFTISEYILAMNAEVNPSPSHKEGQLKTLCYLSDFQNQKPFSKMTRNDVLQYLDSHRRPEESDLTCCFSYG